MDDPDSPSGIRDTFANAHKLYGSHDLSKVFPGGSSDNLAPWPTAGRQKGQPSFDREKVNAVLRQPPELHEFDPRNLHATQPRVVRQHAEYYAKQNEYGTTGRTSADQDNVGNQYPVVYSDQRGRNIILTGHHRALAALVNGQPLRARQVRG
jgi:hypothetical protein